MANRYTRITPSQFNPLSMQEILSVPLSKQKMHDELTSKVDELGLFDINRLSQDEQLASDFINQYKDKLSKTSDRIMKRGIDNLSKQEIRNLVSERNQWLTKGQGRDILANFSAYQKNVEDLKKAYQKGDISRDKYLAGIQSALTNYKGVAEGSSYDPFIPVLDEDINKKATDIAKAVSSNPKKITLFTGLQYNPQTGKYLDVKSNIERTPEDAIKLAVQAGLNLDTGVMSDLQQRSELGMLGNQSIEDYINNLGELNEFIYSKNNIQQTKQYTGIDRSQITSDSTIHNSGEYDFTAAEELKLHNNSLSSKIDKILSGEVQEKVRVPRRDSFGIYDPNADIINKNAGKPYKLDDQEQKEFDSIYKGLSDSGLKISTQNPEYPGVVSDVWIGNLDKNSPEVLGAIQKYLNAHQDIDFQNKVYTEGIFKTYSDLDSKVKQSTPKDLFSGISSQAENRTWIDPETKKVVNYEDLPKDVKEYINSSNGIVSGVYSSSNFLRDQISNVDNPINDRVLISPYEVKFPNGKKYLVSRSEKELNSKSYMLEMEYNDIFRNIYKKPGLPYNTNISGLGKVSIMKDLDGIYINFMNEKSGYSKKPYKVLNDEHLRNIIFNANNIKY